MIHNYDSANTPFSLEENSEFEKSLSLTYVPLLTMFDVAADKSVTKYNFLKVRLLYKSVIRSKIDGFIMQLQLVNTAKISRSH